MPVRWWSACFLCPWSTGISSWWWNKRTLTSSVAMETQHHGHQTLKVSSTLCLPCQGLGHVPISLSLRQLFGIYWAGWVMSTINLSIWKVKAGGYKVVLRYILSSETFWVTWDPFPNSSNQPPTNIIFILKFQQFLIAKISTTPSTMNIP